MLKVETVYPQITSYPAYANHLAMTDVYLQTESRRDYMNWFSEQFISIRYYYDESQVCQAVFDNVFGSTPLHTSEALHFEDYSGQQLCRSGEPLSEFLKERLSNGFAVSMYLNQKYIPAAQCDTDHNHDTFIHAYDEETGCFYISDFFSPSGKYAVQTVSEADINAAFADFAGLNRGIVRVGDIRNSNIRTFKRFDGLKWQFEPEKFLFLVERWLEGKKYADCCYGRACYDYILRNPLLEQDGHMDVRYLHLLYDHKTALISTLLYFQENGYLSGVGDLVEEAASLRELILYFRNTWIKHCIAGREKTGAELFLAKADEIVALDETVFSKVHTLAKGLCGRR